MRLKGEKTVNFESCEYLMSGSIKIVFIWRFIHKSEDFLLGVTRKGAFSFYVAFNRLRDIATKWYCKFSEI